MPTYTKEKYWITQPFHADPDTNINGYWNLLKKFVLKIPQAYGILSVINDLGSWYFPRTGCIGEYSEICEGTLQEAEELATVAEKEIFLKSKNLGKKRLQKSEILSS